MTKQFVSQSCYFNVLPRHTNLFDEYAALCVHLSPQEEDCTSNYWEEGEMCTSGSTANSQGILTKINQSGALAKIRAGVESNAAKH